MPCFSAPLAGPIRPTISGSANVVLGMRLAESAVTAVTINADTDLTIGVLHVVQNENAAVTFQNNSDIVVKLAGQVDLGMAAWGNGAIALA